MKIKLMAGRIFVAAVGLVTEIDSRQQLAAAVFLVKTKKKLDRKRQIYILVLA
jgi:hypothetical protein